MAAFLVHADGALGSIDVFGVLPGNPDEIPPRPPAGNDKVRLLPPLFREPLCKDIPVLDDLGDDDLFGDEELGIVVLPEQGREDLSISGCRPDGRESLRAEGFSLADAQGTDLDVVVFTVEAEDILVLEIRRHHPLLLHRRLEGGDPVAKPRGFLELEVLRRLGHPLSQQIQQFRLAALQEKNRVVDEFPVFLLPDETHAGPQTVADLVLDAGPAPRLELPVLAGPKGEKLMEKLQRLPGSQPRRVGAEAPGTVFLHFSHNLEGGKILAGVKAQADVGLVIPEDHVVAGPVLLDEGVLQEKGLFLGVGDDKIEVAHAGNEERHHRSGVGPLEIVADAAPEVFRLADVDDGALLVLHEVDAGRGGHRVELLLEQLQPFRVL